MLKKTYLIGIVLASIFTLTNCELPENNRQGRILYESYCARCHMDDGTGLRGVIPPLAKSDYVQNNQLELPCIIRVGITGDIMVNGVTYNSVMKGDYTLTHFEISNIINYINQAWGNDFGIIKFDDVQTELEKCPKTYMFR